MSSFANAASSTPGATNWDVTFIASRSSYVAILTTNSPVSCAFLTLSLRRPVPGNAFAENITYGGSYPRLLNWLYGARFVMPSRLIVEIQPTGRGTTIDL